MKFLSVYSWSNIYTSYESCVRHIETLSFRFKCSSIALSIKTIAVLGAILTIYAQDLLIVANEALRSELMSHILAIAFLFAFILYRNVKCSEL